MCFHLFWSWVRLPDLFFFCRNETFYLFATYIKKVLHAAHVGNTQKKAHLGTGRRQARAREVHVPNGFSTTSSIYFKFKLKAYCDGEPSELIRALLLREKLAKHARALQRKKNNITYPWRASPKASRMCTSLFQHHRILKVIAAQMLTG